MILYKYDFILKNFSKMSAIESEFDTMSLDSRGEERMKPTMGEYLKSQTTDIFKLPCS